jgi:superfamily II DNA or RNA helicase
VRPELITEPWTDFKENQCRSAGFKGKGFKISNESDFLTQIEPYCYYLSNDFLKLKPFNIEEHTIELKPKEAAYYRRMEKEYILELQDKIITAPIKLTVISKLQQICCGYINHEKKAIRVGDSKLIYTLKLIDRLPKPIVVFCKYSYDIATLNRYLEGYRVEIISGKTAKTKRPIIIEDFQAGKIDILLSEISTGGVGIDLYKSFTAIGYSYRHSLIQWEQAIARMWRYGQNKAVTMHRLNCTAFGQSTVETDIVAAKNSKSKTSQKIFDRIQKRVDRY